MHVSARFNTIVYVSGVRQVDGCRIARACKRMFMVAFVVLNITICSLSSVKAGE
jgi:hypothetical protein